MKRLRFNTNTRDGEAAFALEIHRSPIITDRILTLLEQYPHVDARMHDDRLLRRSITDSNFRLIKALLSHPSYCNVELNPRIKVSAIMREQIGSMFGGTEMERLLEVEQDLRTELLQMTPPSMERDGDENARPLARLPYLMLVGVVNEHTALLTRLWEGRLDRIFEIDPNSLLAYYVKRGDVDAVAELISDQHVKLTEEAVEFVINRDRVDIIQTILDRIQSDIDDPLDPIDVTVMCLAVKSCAARVLRTVLAHERVRDITNTDMSTFAQVVSESFDMDIVRMSLDFLRGGGIWSRVSTFLGFFAHSSLPIVRMIIEEYGINPAMYMNAFLQTALERGRFDIVRYLLADERVVRSMKPILVLVRAIAARASIANKDDAMELIQLLLADPRVNPAEAAGLFTPLEEAVRTGQIDVIHLLLQDPRVDIAVNDNFPLFEACEKGYVEIVRELLENPHVDVTARGNSIVECTIRSVLFHIRDAVQRGKFLQILEMLLADRRINFSTTSHECLRLVCYHDGDVDVFLCALLRHAHVNPIPDIEQYPHAPPGTWPIIHYYRWTPDSLRALWENVHVRAEHNNTRVAETLAYIMCEPIAIPRDGTRIPRAIRVPEHVYYYIEKYADERRTRDDMVFGTSFTNLLRIIQIKKPPRHDEEEEEEDPVGSPPEKRRKILPGTRGRRNVLMAHPSGVDAIVRATSALAIDSSTNTKRR